MKLTAYTRREAARLILEGNRIVLQDIGHVTARYLDYVHTIQTHERDPEACFSHFLASFQEGPTEKNGQDLLRRGFEHYEMARRATHVAVKCEHSYFANCLAVLHEHVRLQPYIRKSLPFLIRKCVTRRLMTYSVGERTLSVHDNVPPLSRDNFPLELITLECEELKDFLHGPEGWDVAGGTLENTRAMDWTDLRQRMGYVVNLFRTCHLLAEVQSSPYSNEQLEAIEVGSLPNRPW